MELKTEPKVSIGLPVYNGEKWIANTIENLISQSYRNLELIICDNASTDRTQEICNEFVILDSRVKLVVNPENIGLANNYNKSFHCSSGDYFKWSTASDICDKEFVQRCVEVLNNRKDIVLCYPRTKLFVDDIANTERYADNLNLQQKNASERFISLLSIIGLNNAMNGLIRSNVLRRTILHKSFFASDICLMAELALRGKFYEFPEFLFYRRMDKETATKFQTKREIQRYFKPRNSEMMLFQSWKNILNLFAVVQRVPIPLSEKKSAFRFLIKKLYWSKDELYSDLREAIAVTSSWLSASRNN